MTIREEIGKELEKEYDKQIIHWHDYTWSDLTRISDFILNIIEKLIDEKISQVQTMFYSSSKDTDYLRDKRKIQKEILEELKEELNKK